MQAKYLKSSSLLRPSLFLRPFSTTPNLSYAGNKVVGILREDHGMWERRAPLTPLQVKELLSKVPDSRVLVQPCTRRIYSNEEYLKNGAEIKEDLSEANLLLGVKQVKKENILRDKSYFFFSHTIKGQSYSMPLLDACLEKNIRLYDYECITKDGRDDTSRLVAFGKYAGHAGMIDTLHGLGLRLLAEGYNTQFLQICNAYMNISLEDAIENIKKVGQRIETEGLTPELGPLLFAFTGNGNVQHGAYDMFKYFPHEELENLNDYDKIKEEIRLKKRKNNKLYYIHLKTSQLVKPKAPGAVFSREDYYHHPENYEPTFHEEILPHVNVLVNGIYWDARFPRLITKKQLQNLYKDNRNLKIIGDISCDLGGSIEFLSKPTTIEDPFYTYYPSSDEGEIRSDISSKGVLMLGVDNLPSELPRNASEHFGKNLLPLLPPLLTTKGFYEATEKDVDNHFDAATSDIPAELRRACLVSHGKLMPKWRYIQFLREQEESRIAGSAAISAAKYLRDSSEDKLIFPTTSSYNYSASIDLQGHLFDSGAINKILDELENQDLEFTIKKCEIRPNNSSGAQPTLVSIDLFSNQKNNLENVLSKINEIFTENKVAAGKLIVQKDIFHVSAPEKMKTLLLFGSGRVALPIVKLFNTRKNIRLIIAGESVEQAQFLMDAMEDKERVQFLPFKYPQDLSSISKVIKQSDVLVSLLPATMHVPIAELAIKEKKNMVTASYVSPDMKKLHEKAKEQGITILNEAGLDPGIDHMLIMKSIDHILEQGGKITELVSLCGGLPDPIAADNPLKYKFSWSPRGVLNAASNAAQFLNNNKLIQIKGEDLLKSAQPSSRFPTLRLEVLPNRNSLEYRELYKINDVNSICRGTLRYEGWSNVMYALKCLNLFSTSASSDNKDVISYFKSNFNLKEGEKITTKFIKKYLINNFDFTEENASNVAVAVQWLGLTDDSSQESKQTALKHTGPSPIDAFCDLLVTRLKFGDNERDMVAMFHTIVGELPGGKKEIHTSRLLAFGVPGGDTAMSATVGFTAAIGAELLLDEKINDEDLKGVIIPTDKRVYEPMLKRLEEFGITWSETIEKIDS